MEDNEIILVSGDILTINHDPFQSLEGALSLLKDHVLRIQGGQIKKIFPYRDIEQEVASCPQLPQQVDYRGYWLSPGFIDCHIHFPQYEVIASYGEELLEWLNKYTFPEELKFHDLSYGEKIAQKFLPMLFKNGTTTAGVYCSVHPESVEAFFREAEKYQARMVAGKVWMDRHAPQGLLDNPQLAYDQSQVLIKRWHQKGRLRFALTPRFAPTSTPEELEAAGTLWKEYPDLVMQTHLSENIRECAWVKDLFPQCKDYLEVYERYGLLGERSLFGHGIYLSESEKHRLSVAGAAIAHCPSSNMFLGSGLLSVHDCKKSTHSIEIGLATDVGGGSNFSMFDMMKGAYEISQLKGHPLHPYELWYLATEGSARALHLHGLVGNLALGHEADFIVIDPHSTHLIKDRMGRTSQLFEELFAQIILADERAIHATYVNGRKIEYGA